MLVGVLALQGDGRGSWELLDTRTEPDELDI